MQKKKTQTGTTQLSEQKDHTG